MECHRCKHREDLEAGKYAAVPFRKTPCAKCELKEVSLRTMEVDPDRPVYVVGKDAGVETTVPCPEEMEATAEIKLPLDVLEELVSRLLTLPQELRDVVCWRFMGLEYKEIARKQKLTTAGAEARHDRAMRMFPELRQLFIVKTARQTMRRAALIKGVCGV
jgi:hypothetical protein